MGQECLKANETLFSLFNDLEMSLRNGTDDQILSESDVNNIRVASQKLQAASATLSACFLDYEKELDDLLTWLESVYSSTEWSFNSQLDITEITVLLKELEDNVTEFGGIFRTYVAGGLTKIALANITFDHNHLGGLSSSMKTMVEFVQTSVMNTLKSVIANKQEKIISSYIKTLQKLASVRGYLGGEDKVMTDVLRSRKIWQKPVVNLQSPKVQKMFHSQNYQACI